MEQAKPSRKRCLGRLDVKDNKILVVDDVCDCGSPVEWFRPYLGRVNAVRSVWLWLCDRCGRIWTRDFNDNGFAYFKFARQENI